MNVTRHDVDALNAQLKVHIQPEDYQDKVKKALDRYRKQAKIPGFRPGHVPLTMIQKQYGPSILADELNQAVNQALSNYIVENKLDILGNPIPAENQDMKGSFEQPKDFEFTFDIGLAPEFKIPLDNKSKFDYPKVKIDAKMLEQEKNDLRRRYGKMETADVVGEKDLILAQFVELNADESIKEGGVMHTSTVSVEYLENDKVKKSLIGLKKGDKLVVNPIDVSRGGKDTANMLGVEEAQLETLSEKFQLTVNEIRHMVLAELNQEFFDKVFGAGAITNESEMDARLKEDLEKMFANDSDRLLTREVFDYLVDKTKMNLPDAFIKRWIISSNEKPITEEQVESDYPNYAKNLKWQLIQGKMFQEHNLQVDYAALIEFTKGLIANNFAQYGVPAPEDKELTEMAQSALKDRKEMNQIQDMLVERKLVEFIKSYVKLKEKEMPHEDFLKLAYKN